MTMIMIVDEAMERSECITGIEIDISARLGCRQCFIGQMRIKDHDSLSCHPFLHPKRAIVGSQFRIRRAIAVAIGQ